MITAARDPRCMIQAPPVLTIMPDRAELLDFETTITEAVADPVAARGIPQ